MHARRTHFSNALAKAFSKAPPLKWVAKTWPSLSINIVWGMLLIPYSRAAALRHPARSLTW
jgi:hypothetical protein